MTNTKQAQEFGHLNSGRDSEVHHRKGGVCHDHHPMRWSPSPEGKRPCRICGGGE